MTHDGKVHFFLGDCLKHLPVLSAGSVHCCITSPPYFALRSYLPKDHADKSKEIGSEPTPEAFIATMVEVFQAVRRVLHPSGTLWVNLGDSYNGAGDPTGCTGKRCDGGQEWARTSSNVTRNKPINVAGMGKAQLLNMPHRVAEALRQDGWIWRQTIVWHKRSPMPESVSGWRWVRCRVKVASQRTQFQGHASAANHRDKTHGDLRDQPSVEWSDCPGCTKCLPNDGYVLRKGKGRCTTAHEYMFVFAKTDSYFWDSAAFVEKASGLSGGACFGQAGGPGSRRMKPGENERIRGATRNPRSVWTLSSEPTKHKHFATFPSELVRRCVQAGTSNGGCCPKCLMPWAPVVSSPSGGSTGKSRHGHEDDEVTGNFKTERSEGYVPSRILAYRPTCSCGEQSSVPCTVLDPFAGIGTTLQTAIHMGRDAVGIELNPEYAKIARKHILCKPRWLLRKQKPGKLKPNDARQRSLFARED